jgi:hypothetical protein
MNPTLGMVANTGVGPVPSPGLLGANVGASTNRHSHHQPYSAKTSSALKSMNVSK